MKRLYILPVILTLVFVTISCGNNNPGAFFSSLTVDNVRKVEINYGIQHWNQTLTATKAEPLITNLNSISKEKIPI